MAKKHEDIIKQKKALAEDCLKLAERAMGNMEAYIDDCNMRDLITVFNSAIKTHRDLVSDVVELTDAESKEEQELAKEYTGKVEELLKKFSNGGS